MNWIKKIRIGLIERRLVEMEAVYKERIRLHGSGAYIYARELAELHGKISAMQWKLANLNQKKAALIGLPVIDPSLMEVGK